MNMVGVLIMRDNYCKGGEKRAEGENNENVP